MVGEEAIVLEHGDEGLEDANMLYTGWGCNKDVHYMKNMTE